MKLETSTVAASFWPTWLSTFLALACSDTAEPARDGGEVLEPSPGVERAALVADAPTAQLAQGFNDMGFGLLQTQALEDNLVFSPLSVAHALLMARPAADEATGQSIDAALALPAGRAAHQAWNAIDRALAAVSRPDGDVSLALADRVWPRSGLSPDQDWLDLLASEHGVTLRALDFVANPAGSRDTINSWVSEQTDALIPELLPDGFIRPNTVLVLTDAIYLKARWQQPFGKYESVTDTFTLLDGSTRPVELMRELELGDRRGQGDGFVGAEIPYLGGALSMLVLVPDAGRFAEIRAALSQSFLDAVDASFVPGPYELLLPGWATHTELDLVAWLTALGAAPGSYPAISPGAFLGAAVHGADITVDEWGTVAAAATAFGFEESAGPEPVLTVKADRPFLYVIRHRDSGMVLFAGQVTDPGE